MIKRAVNLAAVVCLLVAAFVSPCLAQRSVHVRGYTRKDGTYVAPHYRSAPNRTTADNWSTRGNVNPYTGEAGTRNPDGGSSYGGSSSSTSSGSYMPAAPARPAATPVTPDDPSGDAAGDAAPATANAPIGGADAAAGLSDEDARRVAAAERIHELGWLVVWSDHTLDELLDYESRIRTAQAIDRLGLELDWREYTFQQLRGIHEAIKRR